MKIFLIGFMGAGKTTIGKELARKMHIPFFDLDHILEQEEKRKISEIFESLGEESPTSTPSERTTLASA